MSGLFDVSKEIILITGASQGLGRQFARVLAAHGAAVVLAGQRFGFLQAAGAGLVLAAIVGHELAPVKFKTPEHEPIET